MSLPRGPSVLWATLFRWRLARPHMPFWRVVVEAKLDRGMRQWPERFDGAVTAVFVWARTIEEAEALATLALEEEGLLPLTSDAIKCPPASAPRREAAAVARSAFGYIASGEDEPATPGPSRRDARA